MSKPAWTTHDMTGAPQAPDYRLILKRYMEAVIEADHVIGLDAIDDAHDDDRPILIALGLELTRESGDEWMASILKKKLTP